MTKLICRLGCEAGATLDHRCEQCGAKLVAVPENDALARVTAERDALVAHVEALQEKQAAETCACSHDNATDVCLGHSPMLEKVRAERDALAKAVETLRQELIYVRSDYQCACGHPKCRIEEQRRSIDAVLDANPAAKPKGKNND